ncbi:thiamine phosphate synthase [Flexibacterium corallicola]|uniref:thiamine phosphate synthase n=1 Tax=Flexibacterium corallicola TaxID=3037259 RepID=UPI00286F5636|nr:thiamine phosphate synthase [Pseudovibrio sp. M1P-2-3]
MKPPFNLSLYLVLGPQDCNGIDPVDIALAAANNGTTMVQLRDKSGRSGEQVALGKRLKAALSPLKVPLIINDRVDIALEIGADGAHVGQSDLQAARARELLGPDFILGVSASTRKEFEAIDPKITDYIGLGACFPTGSKDDAEYLDQDLFRTLTHNSKLPVVGIGGINLANAGEVIKNGADGVAVISAICGTSDPAEASRELAQTIKETRGV